MVEKTLKDMADPARQLTHRLLRTLSALDGTALAALADVWPTIAVRRRRSIAAHLVDMAEDDVELDFTDVFRLLLTDEDATVRATAIDGLWEAHDARLIEPLLALMAGDPASEVREAAAAALGTYAVMAAGGKLHGDRSLHLRQALLHTFDDSADPLNTPAVRRAALESVAVFSSDSEVNAAIRRAYADPDASLRAGAVAAMGWGGPEWEELVLRELDSPVAELRFEAARAAGEMGAKAAVPRLVAMTNDPDQEVRLMAVWALGETGDKRAYAVLTALLESADEAMRDAAEDALAELRFLEEPLVPDSLFKPKKPKKE